MTEPDIKKGLAGVVVDTTAVSKVNPETNSLLYRGYPVQDLAANCTFEEVAYLLWNGELPDPAQLAEFEQLERSRRHLPDVAKDAIDLLPLDAHPMDVVRTAVSALGAADPRAADADPEANLDKAITLFAQLPAIVAYIQRRRRGLDLVEPRDDLGYSANFLHMTFGEVPDEVVVSAFDVSMILYAEHSFNASTFTARVVTSTLSDLYSAVVAGIGALKGPLHGGAPGPVLDMLDAIGAPNEAATWIEGELVAGRRIMGMGHRIYRVRDPRAAVLERATKRLEQAGISTGRLELARAVERAAEGALRARHPDRPLLANVEFYTAVLLDTVGLDRAEFSPTFAVGRAGGWTAHVEEQRATGRLIRPASTYVGPMPSP